MQWLIMNTVHAAAQSAKSSSLRLANLSIVKRNDALNAIAQEVLARKEDIVKANRQDMEGSRSLDLPDALIKRLKYDEAKISESIGSIRSLVLQEDPLNRSLGRTELDQGLVLEKVSCPIGVIGVVFESRPDALLQISTLCLKSGNAVLLKGGSEAKRTNQALFDAIQVAIMKVDPLFEGAVQLLSTREEVREMLQLDQYIDLIIPRGSNELVRSIQAQTKIPVLGHSAGICHTYVDSQADIDMALKVCFDAKVQYPAVCNAMETLLVNAEIAETFLPLMAEAYVKAKVELRGDERTREIIEARPASDGDFATEYNDLILNVKVVQDVEEAISHINRYGSHHTDAIVTGDERRARYFQEAVDSASVMWNCSTRFADGFRYGLGAEVGISTNKTHARGPVGLEGLTIYKYRLNGNGHIVADYAGERAKQYTHRKIQ
jgi:glutamate-5-semialdehyde dehydrogenase